MIHLKEVSKQSSQANKTEKFPFNLDIIKNLSKLKFTKEVTFFVGENGTGKSTLLEGIAAGCDLPIVGSRNINQDDTLKYATELSKSLKFSWSIKTNKGFFLRAEDFFGFTKMLNRMRAELGGELDRLNQELPDGYGKNLALGTIRGQIEALTQRYGVDLGASSHGEGFLKLFQSRIVPNGLYLLDEPETPLSPIRQMSLLKIIHDAVKLNCQFIIATHSPIIMAFPNADILDFNQTPPRSIKFDVVDHVQIMKGFLTNKERYLYNLFEE